MRYVYGAGIGGDTLANTPLGHESVSGTKIQFVRFRAQTSGTLDTVTLYRLAAVPKPGYTGGTSGDWKMEIFADDGTTNHFPTGAALAVQSFSASAVDDANFKVTFSSPVTVVAGTLYHVVYTNTDASPDVNFWSPDYWFYRITPTGASTGNNPKFSDTDWAHGYYNDPSGPWTIRTGFTPVMDIGIAGVHQGSSYGEASLASGQQGQISGTSLMVRESFTVSGGDKLVTGAGIRLLKISGGTDPLTVILQTSGGTTIDSFTIAAASIATGLAPDGTDTITGDGSDALWVYGLFASPQILSNGTTYHLRFSTAATTTYWAWVNRRLSDDFPNYGAATGFADGVAGASGSGAEFTTNGSTWQALGVTSTKQDLQFFFGGPGFGMSQAQAKINAFGTAKFAQAQAKLNSFGVNAFGQAQAKLKAFGTTRFGQAQADIKQHYPFSTQQNYVNTILAEASLVSYWRLGTTIGSNQADSKGTKTIGLTGSPTLGAHSLIYSDPDPAITFNGTSQLGSFSDSDSNLPTGNNPWSIEAWIQSSSQKNSNDVIGFGTQSTTSDVALGLQAGQLHFNAHQDDHVFGGAFADGSPHYIIITWDGTTLTGYADGIQVGSTFTMAARTLPAVGTSGGDLAVWIDFFNGTIDEVAIYSSALNSTVIANHYLARLGALNSPFGQAQAKINNNTKWGLGQSRADIKGTSNGFGQAQADIKSTKNGFGQAQAKVIIPSKFGYGQAQVKIQSNYALMIINDNPLVYYRENDASGNLHDELNLNDGIVNGSAITYGTAHTLPNDNDTNNTGVTFNGTSGQYVSATVSTIPATTGGVISVEYWMKWDGTHGSGGMTFGMFTYDMLFQGGFFGFNSGSGDITGVSNTSFNGVWVYVVGVMYHNNSAADKLYINGVLQTMTGSITNNEPLSTTFKISGWTNGNGQEYSGAMDEFAIYGRELTARTVANHYQGFAFAQGFGQAQASVVASYHQGFGQAQALISSTKRRFSGQAQAFIHTNSGWGSGQANVYISPLPALVQVGSSGFINLGLGETGTATLGSTPTVGNLLIAGISSEGASTVSMTGWTLITDSLTTYTNGQGTGGPRWFYSRVVQAGDTTSVATFTDTTAPGRPVSFDFVIHVAEYSGLGTGPIIGNIGWFDMTTGNQSTAPIPSQIPPAYSPAILISFADINPNYDPIWPTGWTREEHINGGTRHTFDLGDRVVYNPDGVTDYSGTLTGAGGETAWHVVSFYAQWFNPVFIAGFGQANTDIKATTYQFAQAQVDIKVTSRGYGQAQARWVYTRFQEAQVQAFIIHVRQQFAQANADIKTTTQVYAQAQADIKVTSRVEAQAQGVVVKRHLPTGQAQTLIVRAVGPNQPFGPSQYVVVFNGQQLPGYAQAEALSVEKILVDNLAFKWDGDITEQAGESNTILTMKFLIYNLGYRTGKDGIYLARNILRSTRDFAPLYIDYSDRYWLARVKTISYSEATTPEKIFIYTVDFEVQPYAIGQLTNTLQGTGTLATTGRTLMDGTWSPTLVTMTGSDITISGYTDTETCTGYISVSGYVPNMIIDTDNFNYTVDGNVPSVDVMNWKDYQLYVGPGITTFSVTGAETISISYKNRW